jgi:hypothetical protein
MTTLKEFQDDPDSMFDFLEFFMKFKPHNYQKEFLLNCLLYSKVLGLWPRQSGKSTSVGAYCGFRCSVEKTAIMITAPTQTQSSELYNKIRSFIESNDVLAKNLSKSTQTEMLFKNGSRIKALPSGSEGKTIRGFTADVVIEEEAGILKDEINNKVIMPMLASKKEKGQIIKIGTPLSRNHFYRSAFLDPLFKVVKINYLECIKEGQYSKEWIMEQKEQLTDIEFRTEYEAEFVDELLSFFPPELIDNRMFDYELIQLN